MLEGRPRRLHVRIASNTSRIATLDLPHGRGSPRSFCVSKRIVTGRDSRRSCLVRNGRSSSSTGYSSRPQRRAHLPRALQLAACVAEPDHAAAMSMPSARHHWTGAREPVPDKITRLADTSVLVRLLPHDPHSWWCAATFHEDAGAFAKHLVKPLSPLAPDHDRMPFVFLPPPLLSV